MTTSSWTVETRRANEAQLLAEYHATLIRLGIQDVTLETITERYDLAVLFVLNFHMIIAGAFVPSTERAKKMAEEGVHRAVQAVLDRGLLNLIPSART